MLTFVYDDYGYDENTSAIIRATYRPGERVSVMVDYISSYDLDLALDSFDPQSIGIHIDLVEFDTISLLSYKNISSEIERQVKKFIDLLHQKPAHIDFHHNIHKFPLVLFTISRFMKKTQLYELRPLFQVNRISLENIVAKIMQVFFFPILVFSPWPHIQFS